MIRSTALACADRAWSRDRYTRIRLKQWSVTLVIYIASGAAMAAGAAAGWLPVAPLLGWCGFVAVGLATFYAAIRSGWSRRFVDGALTEWQIAFGVLTVIWGYAMCGALRSATLFPLMVILTFGAFSLSWRRIARLTGCALIGLAVAMAGLRLAPGPPLDARVDLANFLIIAIMLPASSVLAGLLGALRRRLHQQRTELTAALARIHELAVTDDLTGLPNRRHAQSLLENECQRSLRSGHDFALALVDIDHFKHINDLHGHATGDQALQAFARQSTAGLRSHDIVARWGGEEFIVLMPETSLAAGYETVDRLREQVCRATAPTAAAEIKMTFSAGVVAASAGETAVELIARADRALYTAKRQGRNRVVVDAGSARQPVLESTAACTLA